MGVGSATENTLLILFNSSAQVTLLYTVKSFSSLIQFFFFLSKYLPRKLWKFLSGNQEALPDTGGKLPSLSPRMCHVDIIAHWMIYVNEHIVSRYISGYLIYSKLKSTS